MNLPPSMRDNEKRIVIQHCRSKQFLACREELKWTDSLEDATPFASSGQAALQCLRLHLDDVQVLLTFGSRQYDLVLPIHDSAREPGPGPRRER